MTTLYTEVDNTIAAAQAAFDVYPELAASGDWDAFTRASVEIFNFDETPIIEGDWITDFEREFDSVNAEIDRISASFN